MWDNELNEVWDALNRLLSPEDMAGNVRRKLRQAQRAAELTRERVGVLEEYLETL